LPISNSNVEHFLTIYSQSNLSTGGTRGYDPDTYVETKLDHNLVPRIFNPKTKLVILTGNAGDGKTAFIQRVELMAENKGAKILKRTDNGCIFTLNSITYQTLYDGSQDFEGTENDAVLAAFFNDLEGQEVPHGDFTKVIAINEGKLRDFIFFKPQYRWLGKQVHHYLNFTDFKLDESLVFVNLNLRSMVGSNADENSIIDLLLDKFLDTSFWNPCLTCENSEKCYIRYNVSSFNDPKRGPQIRHRLKTLLLAVHFRKTRHITMRDLRSILSLILFGKLACNDIYEGLDTDQQLIGSFYYNAAFSRQETDRIAQLLSDMDVANVSNPKLDNFIHFHPPDSPEVLELIIASENTYQADLPYLSALYANRPEGTQDEDLNHRDNARFYHASMRRKLFFEGDEARLREAGLPTWKDLLPYRQFDRFHNVINNRGDTDNALRDELTLAISKRSDKSIYASAQPVVNGSKQSLFMVFLRQILRS
jgi:hypothetical protein